MPRELKAYFEDIKMAIDKIEKYTLILALTKSTSIGLTAVLGVLLFIYM